MQILRDLKSTKPSRCVRLLFWTGVALALASADVSAKPTCRHVKGSFNLIPVDGEACTSPVGVCGEGTFTGGLKGDYFSPFLTITETAETSQTGYFHFTAETTFPAAKIDSWEGELFFKEAGSLHTTGRGEFVELFSVASGTGDFSGATGDLKTTGNFDPVSGGKGQYDGYICVP